MFDWMRGGGPLAASVLTVLGLAVRADAHDTWLLPDDFHPRGPRVVLRMTSGMEFPKLDVAVKPDRIARSGVRSGGQAADLALGEAAGGALELVAPLAREGVAVAWAESRPRTIDLKPEQVPHYLEEVGARETLGPVWEAAGSPAVQESYVKLAKAYLRRGREADASWRAPVGLALELVPEADPTTLRRGDRLSVVLLWQGKPLAGLSVSAARGGAARTAAGKTAADGRFTVDLDQAGPWMLRATRVVAGPGGAAQWEGTFTTMTFEVAEAGDRPR